MTIHAARAPDSIGGRESLPRGPHRKNVHPDPTRGRPSQPMIACHKKVFARAEKNAIINERITLHSLGGVSRFISAIGRMPPPGIRPEHPTNL